RPDHSEIDARIASAVEVEREISADVLGEVVAEERASTAWKLGQEVKKLRAEIERMRAARETERAALRDEISSMRETHTRDLAELTRRFAAIERQLDRLDAKRAIDDVRADVVEGFAQVRETFVLKSKQV